MSCITGTACTYIAIATRASVTLLQTLRSGANHKKNSIAILGFWMEV